MNLKATNNQISIKDLRNVEVSKVLATTAKKTLILNVSVNNHDIYQPTVKCIYLVSYYNKEKEKHNYYFESLPAAVKKYNSLE